MQEQKKQKYFIVIIFYSSLQEKCPNTELFLVQIQESTDQK